jgi:hypothetical protein
VITQEYLKSILQYDKDTGLFTWVINKSGIRGLIAGSIDFKGYRIIGINNKRYRSHRLAWLYVYGKLPMGIIDHINGIVDDNRIENLRDVTSRINNQNTKSHRSGKLVGCSWAKHTNRWMARIKTNGKTKYLGYYDTELEAHKAYLKYISKTGG